MSEIQNLHNNVIAETRQYVESLNIEKQLIKVIKRSKGSLSFSSNTDSESDNYLEQYFQSLIDEFGIKTSKKYPNVTEKEDYYQKKAEVLNERLKSVDNLLKGIDTINDNSLQSFSSDLKQSLIYQKNVVEEEIKEIKNVMNLIKRINDKSATSIMVELKDKLMELYKLIRTFYINSYTKTFGEFLNKKVHAKLHEFNDNFVFTQVMKKEHGSLDDKILLHLKEYFEMSLFVNNSQVIYELRKARKNEFYEWGYRSTKKQMPLKRLESFINKHKEFKVYFYLLKELNAQIQDQDWYNPTMRNIQSVLIQHKSPNLINLFNELLTEVQKNTSTDDSEGKDISLGDFSTAMNIELLTEERNDLISQSYKIGHLGFNSKKDTRTVVIGFKKNDMIFV